ncbi:hypothetical protein [Paraburkholderia terrae]|uniref:hypothetical protein n=1 Tax=Paraburkholderia terrae TaxID=311230 RepID=UPI0020681B5C|nr:hypothetical protein [Paraburkholderia terrae]BDC46018.1 hypothetical protein PTKU15_93150 [Paraburkholderia terrae]
MHDLGGAAAKRFAAHGNSSIPTKPETHKVCLRGRPHRINEFANGIPFKPRMDFMMFHRSMMIGGKSEQSRTVFNSEGMIRLCRITEFVTIAGSRYPDNQIPQRWVKGHRIT